MRNVGSAVLAALILAACGDSRLETSPGTGGALELSLGADGASGAYSVGDSLVTFRSREQSPGVFDVEVEVNGLALTALIDPANGVSTLDGYASANGGDSQLIDDDRRALEALYRSLNDELPVEQLTPVTRYLRRAVGLWAQTPTTVPLNRLVVGEQGRGYTMLCSYARCGGGNYTGSCNGAYNWYSYAKHDCSRGGFGYERNQQIAQLGDHYSCSGDEWYLSNGTWVCGEPDHWWRPKVVGNCFGRCGGGCGGDTQYTLDATNHDGCVRNGHALASLYCDDQFTSASDDELFAPDCY